MGDDILKIINRNKNDIKENIQERIIASPVRIIEIVYLMDKFANSCILMPLEFSSNIDDIYAYETTLHFALSWFADSQSLQFPEEGGKDVYDKLIRNCVDEKDKRFIVIPLELWGVYNGKPANHSNILIYDKKTNVMERFDPWGNSTWSVYKPQLLDKKLKEYFSTFFDNLKFITPELICDRRLQGIAEKYAYDEKGIELPGFCSIWSFAYTYLRLLHPDNTHKEIIDMMYRGGEGSEVYEFITQFRDFLVDMMKEIFEVKTIEEFSEVMYKYLHKIIN